MTCAGFMLKESTFSGKGKEHLCRVLPTTPIPPVCFLATSAGSDAIRPWSTYIYKKTVFTISQTAATLFKTDD